MEFFNNFLSCPLNHFQSNRRLTKKPIKIGINPSNPYKITVYISMSVHCVALIVTPKHPQRILSLKSDEWRPPIDLPGASFLRHFSFGTNFQVSFLVGFFFFLNVRFLQPESKSPEAYPAIRSPFLSVRRYLKTLRVSIVKHRKIAARFLVVCIILCINYLKQSNSLNQNIF